MDKLTTLGIAKALEGHIKEARVTLETECKAELAEEYRKNGTKQREVQVDGVQVGTLYVAKDKAHTEVTDQDAYRRWLEANGYVDHVRAINPAKLPLDEVAKLWPEAIYNEALVSEPELARVAGHIVDAATGVVVDGVSWVPDGIKYVGLKGCAWDDVRPLLGDAQLVELLDGINERTLPIGTEELGGRGWD